MERVLVFGITENPGGVESVIMNYYRALYKEIQFDFLCNTEVVAYESEIQSLGGQIYRIPMRARSFFQYKKALKEFFDKNGSKYNSIWVNVCSLANIDYLKEAKRVGIPNRIIHSHNSMNMDSKLRGMVHKLNRKQITKFATAYWACSKEAAEWFYPESILKNNQYKIVYNAIDFDKYKYDVKVRDKIRTQFGWQNKHVIGNVGRLHFQKNQMFLLDIFNEISKKDPTAVLALVGEGEDRQKLVDRAEELGLTDKVQLLGLQSDIPGLLNGFDLFLFPSLFEGLPLALIEAQASSLPCLSSNTFAIEMVNFSHCVEFMSLEQSASLWAKKAVEMIKEPRKNLPESLLAASEFNIRYESQKIRDSFLEGK